MGIWYRGRRYEVHTEAELAGLLAWLKTADKAA
jgi:hypothetical protein